MKHYLTVGFCFLGRLSYCLVVWTLFVIFTLGRVGISQVVQKKTQTEGRRKKQDTDSEL